MSDDQITTADILRSHVSRHGMTNELLDSICKALCSNYCGLFTVYNLPKKPFYKKNYSIIVYLADNATNGHYVSIHYSPNAIIYIDPCGLPCFDPTLRQFLRKHKKKNQQLFNNYKAIQHKKSTFCGMYAILFTLYYDKPSLKGAIKFNFTKRASFKNDELCMKYINDILIKR